MEITEWETGEGEVLFRNVTLNHRKNGKRIRMFVLMEAPLCYAIALPGTAGRLVRYA